MICKHLQKNQCELVNRLTGKEITVPFAACEQCNKESKPQQENKVVYGLAFHHANEKDRQKILELLIPGTKTKTQVTELGPALWRELFLTIESQSQLEYWESRIQNYQCGGKCKRFYLDWKKNNPPAFPLSFNWKWKLKNAVNAKLGQKIMSLDDAFAFWSSQRGNDV
jgi:hypothetical protein